MQLQQQGRPAAGHAADDRGLPQRPRPIEVRHGRDARQLQHGVHGSRFGSRDPAKVEGQIEVGVVFPTRRQRIP